MSKPFRVTIDLDGVLYRWTATANLLLEWEFGIFLGETLTWNHIYDQVTERQWNWLMTEGIERGLYRHGGPYRGSFEAMRELDKFADITIVTHRPRAALQDTRDWVAFQFKGIDTPTVQMLFKEEQKSSVYPHAHLYVDDKAENCVDLFVNTDARVCLWERPWNEQARSWLPAEILRVNDWKDFIDIAKSTAWEITREDNGTIHKSIESESTSSQDQWEAKTVGWGHAAR